MNKDIVIFGSKYLSQVNKAYYPSSVIILKKGESPAPFIKEGINHFIFDYMNQYELITALFKQAKVLIRASSEIKDILEDSVFTRFTLGDYDFRFDLNIYLYKGKPIYLQKAQKIYLAQWLLFGNKDNSKRAIVCKLRKKLGSDFLKDIDRFGRLKEEK